MTTVLWIMPVFSFLMSWGSFRLVGNWRWNSQPVQLCAKWKVYGTDLSIISTWVYVPRFPFWQLNATGPRLSPLGFKGIFKGFTEVWMCPLQRFCTCIKPKYLDLKLIDFYVKTSFFIYGRTYKYSMKRIFNFSVRRSVWPLSQNAVINDIVLHIILIKY